LFISFIINLPAVKDTGRVTRKIPIKIKKLLFCELFIEVENIIIGTKKGKIITNCRILFRFS